MPDHLSAYIVVNQEISNQKSNKGGLPTALPARHSEFVTGVIYAHRLGRNWTAP